MCNEIEKRVVGELVVIGVEQCRLRDGGRGFIPRPVDPGVNMYGVPDWITGFEVLNSKGEVVFRLPVGAQIRVAI